MANPYRFSKSAAFILDTKGFDKMVNALSPENRKPVLRKVMSLGSALVQKSIRSVYKASKPDSNLDEAIVRHIYPSAEGAVVRRYYVKAGKGKNYKGDSPYYRAYVLNFLNAGANNRQTKGNGRYRGLKLNRGSIPALKFFQKGRNRSRSREFKEIERHLLIELAKQARK